MSTGEKITRTQSHVYLELSAKRASVRTYINMHARKKTHVVRYLFACSNSVTQLTCFIVSALQSEVLESDKEKKFEERVRGMSLLVVDDTIHIVLLLVWLS